MSKEKIGYDYLDNDWYDIKEIKKILDELNASIVTDEGEIYNYNQKAFYMLRNKANMGDALSWQEISHQLSNYTFPINTLIVGKKYCVGYVTELIEGINGTQMLQKLTSLESRRAIANWLITMYDNMKRMSISYTNWSLEDLLVTRSRKLILINSHFFIEDKKNTKPFVDYNFCVLIFSILYGLDFSIVNPEEIPELHIPEAIKEILSKKKNEKITIEEIKKITRLTQKEFVYQPQIQKLIRKFSVTKSTN